MFSAYPAAQVREAIFSTVAAARAEGFHVQVCRHDLFHGHLFRGERGEVGILLHACEYPSQNDDFPVNLGFCQADTQVGGAESKGIEKP